MKVLFDCVYINNLGGESLLNYLLKKVEKTDIDFFYLFDSRLAKKNYCKIKSNRYLIMNPSEIERYLFYKKTSKDFDKYFCFSNVPPPISLKKSVFIYFHNDLLLSTTNTGYKLKKKLIFFLKKVYIHVVNKKNYTWVVQTNSMKKKLKIFFPYNAINVFPIFEEFRVKTYANKIENSFLYPAGYFKHKNHKNLFRGLEVFSNSCNKKISIRLTIEEYRLNQLKIEFKDLFNKVDIINLGYLTKEDLIKYYKQSEFVIYPSLKESFGLPLIEASQFGCKVIASNLPYVHDVIKPSVVFNPSSPYEISEAIKRVLTSKKHTFIKTKDTLNDLLVKLNE